jgi:Spy/CpxP family protein refolding chaperone
MKKLMMIAVLVGLTVAAQAQDKERKTPEERAQMRTEHMTKELGLSAEQAAKVQAINLKYADQGEELRKEREGDHAEARKDGKAMRDAHDAEMKAVLTPEQYTKWQEKKAAIKTKHMEKRKAMQGEKRGR